MSLQARITALAQAVAADVKSLGTELAGKEPSLPAGGNSGHYLRGDKTWGVTGTAVRTAALTGLGTGSNTPIAATDTVLAAFAGLQAQVSAREPAITAGTGQQYIGGDKVLRDFATVTRAVALTGLPTPTNVAILSTDQLLTALAKLQGQVTARMANPMTTAGDMIRGGTSGAPERVAAGTNGHVWTMVSGVPGWAAAGGVAPYESAEQTITVGGALTLSHGLGAKPKFIAGAYVCKTAEAGYSVGDEAYDGLTYAYTDAGVNVTTTAGSDATNIYLVFQNGAGNVRIRHKTSGALVTVTPANWRYIVRARL